MPRTIPGRFVWALALWTVMAITHKLTAPFVHPAPVHWAWAEWFETTAYGHTFPFLMSWLAAKWIVMEDT